MRNLLATFSLLLPGFASAENFVQVNFDEVPKEIRTSNYFVDIDSFKKDTEKSGTYFTYRVGDLKGGGLSTALLEIDAIASCGNFALLNLRIKTVGYGQKEIADETFSDEKGWKKKPFYDVQNLSLSGESLMLLEVCQRTYPEILKGMMSPPKDGCPGKAKFDSVLCRLGERNRYNLRLVKERVDFVGRNCGNTEYLNSTFGKILGSVEVCGNDKMCFIARSGGLANSLADDTSKIVSSLIYTEGRPLNLDEVCRAKSAVEQDAEYRKRVNDRLQEEKKTNEELWQCVKDQARSLDDGVSDSSTIAKVLLRKCDEKVSAILAIDWGFSRKKVTREEYLKEVEPDVIEEILKFRRKKK